MAPNLLIQKHTENGEISAHKEQPVNTGTTLEHVKQTTDSLPKSPCYHNQPPQRMEETTTLSQITSEAGFSLLVPRLQQALDHMSSPENNVVLTLNENVLRLQDSFVDTLYATLSSAGVDLNHKVTLCLDKNGQLFVQGSHPNKTSIDTLLAQSPELSVAFIEIASQSAALRDIRSLHTLVMNIAGVDHYTNMVKPPKDNAYQVSIKGEMNHFYFNNPHYLS